MSQIDVHIGGRNYTLACASGGEERLNELAEYVNKKAVDLNDKLGHVSESKLLLMTAIIIADELKDALEKDGRKIDAKYTDGELAAIIDEVSVEIEGIAQQLSTS